MIVSRRAAASAAPCRHDAGRTAPGSAGTARAATNCAAFSDTARGCAARTTAVPRAAPARGAGRRDWRSTGRNDLARPPPTAPRRRGCARPVPTSAAGLDTVAARRQSLGQRDERRLGAAERSDLDARTVERDAVIGHHDVRHQPLRISLEPVRSIPLAAGPSEPSGGSSRAFKYDRIGKAPRTAQSANPIRPRDNPGGRHSISQKREAIRRKFCRGCRCRRCRANPAPARWYTDRGGAACPRCRDRRNAPAARAKIEPWPPDSAIAGCTRPAARSLGAPPEQRGMRQAAERRPPAPAQRRSPM